MEHKLAAWSLVLVYVHPGWTLIVCLSVDVMGNGSWVASISRQRLRTPYVHTRHGRDQRAATASTDYWWIQCVTHACARSWSDICSRLLSLRLALVTYVKHFVAEMQLLRIIRHLAHRVPDSS